MEKAIFASSLAEELRPVLRTPDCALKGEELITGLLFTLQGFLSSFVLLFGSWKLKMERDSSKNLSSQLFYTYFF